MEAGPLRWKRDRRLGGDGAVFCRADYFDPDCTRTLCRLIKLGKAYCLRT